MYRWSYTLRTDSLTTPNSPRPQPQPRATAPTPHGGIAVAWETFGPAECLLRVAVPAGVRATVRFPVAGVPVHRLGEAEDDEPAVVADAEAIPLVGPATAAWATLSCAGLADLSCVRWGRQESVVAFFRATSQVCNHLCSSGIPESSLNLEPGDTRLSSPKIRAEWSLNS